MLYTIDEDFNIPFERLEKIRQEQEIRDIEKRYEDDFEEQE